MALVLDVARFKYPPHWVPLKLLWEAMDTVDGDSSRPRGYVFVYASFSEIIRSPYLSHDGLLFMEAVFQTDVILCKW